MCNNGGIVKIQSTVLLEKQIAETPLECLGRFRAEKIAAGEADYASIPMTYAGRLDPMASGVLLVLLGEECKKKEKYLGFEKEYEVEILFGVETDTQDVLGAITSIYNGVDIVEKITHIDLQKYVGKFTQKYPAYSSKTVNGEQLHNLARAGGLPDEMPTKQVEIYSIERTGEKKMNGAEIAKSAVENISKVHGDFRQQEIVNGWHAFSEKYGKNTFQILKIRVSCSSGTYMRSLAEKIGADVQVGSLAFSIHRTKIKGF